MNQAELDRVWYGDKAPGALLGTLEMVYRAASARRRDKERARLAEDLVGRPILVVGNLTAGGTGKTPVVIRLCELFSEAGLSPAVISRGYGREGRAPLRVDPQTPARLGGDEPVLIARRTGAPVYVDRDRESAARTAFDNGADVVIADDGLQRLRLPRVIEICVVDGRRGFGNERLLPAGPLREPLERLATVDWVICNGETSTARLPENRTVVMTMVPERFVRLSDGETVRVEDAADRLQDRAASAVTAIGNPDRFFHTLTQLGIDVDVRRQFNDHHTFMVNDFKGLDGPILVTEKDAVKCGELGLANAWYLEVSARFPAGWEADMTSALTGHVQAWKEQRL